MSKETEEPRFKRISWIVWGVLAVLMVFLVSAFVHAMTLNHTLREKVAVLEPMLAEQQAENATLQAQLAYVQSDAYIEAWAREHAGMTYPEETLVIPVAVTPTPSPTTPQASATPTPAPTPQPFWERWWQALFGG
ncbi:MAG: septum formation initiator family protein [Anaerolineae bacterium]|nr:septum formation initiator family protein [Anaerolineae bacterium]